MYVFIPDHFRVHKSYYAEETRIFSQTHLCKGVRFFSTHGKWIYSSNAFNNQTSDQVHWLRILFTYSHDNNADIDCTNALVFRENSQLILETVHPIANKTIIHATFHDLSLDEIISLTQGNVTNKFAVMAKPLDLSQTKMNPSNTTSEKKPLRKRKQMLPCDLCKKEFDRPSLLKRHVRTHTGERPHVCEVCGKGFSTSSSLNTHKRIHSGERPHQCGICGKRFTASSNLYYHRLTHTTEKPHKCDVCGKSFPTPGNLRSHKYSHAGLSPYKCTICCRVFTKQINLKNHLILHKR